MKKIHVLDQDTVNQIAAGEVIERPSSVVKELVENAVDAKAAAVTVEIRDGGKSLIRVTDNGSGFDPEDIRTAFMPHATSKISSADDLIGVGSLGFRGEALPSAASVSKVELITRTAGEITGIRYTNEGGTETGYAEVGAPEGTTVIIRDLFFNTPARKKFLKKGTTEASYVSTLMERLALSNPGVAMRLISDDRIRLSTSGNGKLKDIIYSVYGKEAAAALLPVEGSSSGITVSGFAARPAYSRANRTAETFFVDGRYVRNPILCKAVENAYHGYLMQHRYPFVILFITFPAGAVDVNVHPAKLEIRFSDEDLTYQAVYEAVRGAFASAELIESQRLINERKESRPDYGAEPFLTGKTAAAEGADDAGAERVREENPSFEKEPSGSRESAYDREPSYVKEPSYVREPSYAREPSYVRKPSSIELLMKSWDAERAGRPDAVNRRAQILPDAESEDIRPEVPAKETAGQGGPGQEPVLQEDIRHEPAGREDTQEAPEAAEQPETPLFGTQERLFTEDTRKDYRIIGQLFGTYWLFEYKDRFLMMDQHAAHEKVLYERNLQLFRSRQVTSQMLMPPYEPALSVKEMQMFSENIRSFRELGFEFGNSGGKLVMTAVPGNLPGVQWQDVFTELVDAVSGETGHEQLHILEEKLALMSCKAAVKGNDRRISLPEVNELLDSLLKLDNPYMCPHGRPTMIAMSKYEIEKRFSRVVM